MAATSVIVSAWNPATFSESEHVQTYQVGQHFICEEYTRFIYPVPLRNLGVEVKMKVDESNSKVAYYCGDVAGYGGPKISPLVLTSVFLQPENLKKTVVKPDGSLKTFLELTIL